MLEQISIPIFFQSIIKKSGIANFKEKPELIIRIKIPMDSSAAADTLSASSVEQFDYPDTNECLYNNHYDNNDVWAWSLLFP